MLLLAAAPALGAGRWDLLVEADADGNVTVLSRTSGEGGDPPAPPQPPQEGLSYLEVRDAEGRLLDRRAVPLAPDVFHDDSGAGGLQGGTAPAPKMQFHLRLPRVSGQGQSVRFFRVRRRNGAKAPSALPGAAAPAASDFDLEPRGAANLGDVP